MTPIQEVILQIFKEVSKICDSNNIPYYAIGGTCIGAIRHKGFIPWDDDLDIAVPIEHWYRLVDLLRSSLPSNLYVYTPDEISPFHHIWLKVCDKNTTFIEKSEYKLKEAWKGVFIDIMPLSGVPENDPDLSRFIRTISNIEKCNDYLRFPNVIHSVRAFVGRMPFRLISKILPFNFFSKKFIHTLGKYPLKTSTKTGYVWHPQWLPRLIFPTSYFGNGLFVEFEDTFIRVPSKFHEYLSQQFGDYMQLPPEEKKAIHDGFVDVSTPFTYYLKHGIQ